MEMGMTPIPVENNFHGFKKNCCRLALGCRPMWAAEMSALWRYSTITDTTFEGIPWKYFCPILEYCEWCFKSFYFSAIAVQFSLELFSVAVHI